MVSALRNSNGFSYAKFEWFQLCEITLSLLLHCTAPPAPFIIHELPLQTFQALDISRLNQIYQFKHIYIYGIYLSFSSLPL